MKRTIITLILLATLLTACTETLSEEEMITKVLEQQAALNSYRATGTIDMNMKMNAQGFNMNADMKTTMETAIDVQEQEAAIEMKMEAKLFGSTETTTNIYIKDGYVYTEVLGQWIKEKTEEDLFQGQNTLDEAADFLALGTHTIDDETIDGTDYYVVRTDINPEELIALIMQEEDAEIFQEEESSEIRDAIQNYSLTIYVNKDTLYIERMKTFLELRMDEEEGSISLAMDMDITYYDFNEDIDITLPPNAEEATDFGGLLGDPDRFLPDRCTLQGGFSCVDWSIDGDNNEIDFSIVNNLGVDITNTTVTFESEDCAPSAETRETWVGGMNPRDLHEIMVLCTNDISDEVSGDITISYVRVGETESHVASGVITGVAEASRDFPTGFTGGVVADVLG